MTNMEIHVAGRDQSLMTSNGTKVTILKPVLKVGAVMVQIRLFLGRIILLYSST